MVKPAELIGHTLLGRYRVTRDRGNGCEGSLLRAALTGHALLGNAFADSVNTNVMLEVICNGYRYDARQVDDLAALQPQHGLLGCQEVGVIGDGDLAGATYVVWEPWDKTLAQVLASRSRLEHQEVRTVAREIAAALARYHSDGRIHGDVRPERICQVDRRWKLAPILRRTTNGKGAAPVRRATIQDDIYALGLVLLGCLSPAFTMLRAKAPQGVVSRAQIELAIHSLPEFWQGWLGRCLAAEPSERCSAAEVALMDAENPPPLAEVLVEREDTFFRLQWQPPARGAVEVYYWSGDRLPKRGEIWLHVDLQRVAGAVPVTMQAGTHVQMQSGPGCQVVVFTVVGEAAVVGESITLSRFSDVQQLELTVQGDTITATWQWPADAYLAEVVVRLGEFPTGPEDPLAQAVPCFRAGYVRKNRFTIPINHRTGVIHVAVYAKYPREDGWDVASGRTAGARKIVTFAQDRYQTALSEKLNDVNWPTP